MVRTEDQCPLWDIICRDRPNSWCPLYPRKLPRLSPTSAAVKGQKQTCPLTSKTPILRRANVRDGPVRAVPTIGKRALHAIFTRKPMSRRGFCLCCVGGAAYAGTGWLTPREAFAEARGLVSLFKDNAAVASVATHKLRNNISVLEGPAATSPF